MSLELKEKIWFKAQSNTKQIPKLHFSYSREHLLGMCWGEPRVGVTPFISHALLITSITTILICFQWSRLFWQNIRMEFSPWLNIYMVLIPPIKEEHYSNEHGERQRERLKPQFGGWLQAICGTNPIYFMLEFHCDWLYELIMVKASQSYLFIDSVFSAVLYILALLKKQIHFLIG